MKNLIDLYTVVLVFKYVNRLCHDIATLGHFLQYDETVACFPSLSKWEKALHLRYINQCQSTGKSTAVTKAFNPIAKPANAATISPI